MSESIKPEITEAGVVRFKNETVSPATRVGFTILLGAGILVFGLVGEAFGVIDAVVSVGVVAVFHVLMNRRHQASTAAKRPSKLAGTLESAKSDMPWLQVFLDPGSMLVETGKGIGKGIAFLLAKSLATFLYSVILLDVSVLGESLPWLGIGILILAAAAAWNFEGFKNLLKPLIKIRKAEDTPDTPADTPPEKDS